MRAVTAGCLDVAAPVPLWIVDDANDPGVTILRAGLLYDLNATTPFAYDNWQLASAPVKQNGRPHDGARRG